VSALVLINGQRHDKLRAGLAVLDHGLLYGDGITMGFRIERGQAIQATARLEAFLSWSLQLGFQVPYELAKWGDILRQAIQETERQSGYARLLLTRGAGTLGPDPRKCEPNWILIVDDYVPYPPEVARGGLEVIVARGIRRRVDACEDLGLTLANRLAVQAYQEALRQGCLDAILLSPQDELTGTIEGQLVLVGPEPSSQLRTPPRDQSPDRLAHLMIPGHEIIQETPLQAAELFQAHEVFLISTAAGVVPVTRIDGQAVGVGDQAGLPGPVTSQFQARWAECR